MRVFALVMVLLSVMLIGQFGLWTPATAAMFMMNPALPAAIQHGVQFSLPAWFWDPLLKEVLRWPAWVLPSAAALFAMLGTLGRPGPRG